MHELLSPNLGSSPLLLYFSAVNHLYACTVVFPSFIIIIFGLYLGRRSFLFLPLQQHKWDARRGHLSREVFTYWFLKLISKCKRGIGNYILSSLSLLKLGNECLFIFNRKAPTCQKDIRHVYLLCDGGSSSWNHTTALKCPLKIISCISIILTILFVYVRVFFGKVPTSSKIKKKKWKNNIAS